jgi:uncharacterized protein (TIGR02266 family)
VTKYVDKRGPERTKRRVLVRFREDETSRSGYSKNLSETGTFVQTNMVSKPGTVIHVELEFPGGKISMRARVAWAKKVPPNLAHILDCGMGLQFLDPPPEWPQFYREWREKVGG